jgi:hypothetical protein
MLSGDLSCGDAVRPATKRYAGVTTPRRSHPLSGVSLKTSYRLRHSCVNIPGFHTSAWGFWRGYSREFGQAAGARLLVVEASPSLIGRNLKMVRSRCSMTAENMYPCEGTEDIASVAVPRWRFPRQAAHLPVSSGRWTSLSRTPRISNLDSVQAGTPGPSLPPRLTHSCLVRPAPQLVRRWSTLPEREPPCDHRPAPLRELPGGNQRVRRPTFHFQIVSSKRRAAGGLGGRL